MLSTHTHTGTDAERGLILWRCESGTAEDGGQGPGLEMYSLPLVSRCIDRFPWLGRLPFCPAARKRSVSLTSAKLADDDKLSREAVIATAGYGQDGQDAV